MTYKLAVESLGQLTAAAFAVMVHNRIATLQEYDAHEAIVRQHALIEDMPAAERYVSLAVPAAPVEVDAAIRRTPRENGATEFTADYEIVGPSFETKKARLFDQVSAAERDAIAAVVPAGKVRAFHFREMDIRKADSIRYQTAVVGLAKDVQPPDFASFTAENRPLSDNRFLDEQAAREDQRNEIMRWAAGLHSDIEDLTSDTIDAWEMKPFRG